MEHLVLSIEDMHCQACVKNVTGVLRALPGVSQVEVSLEEGKARIAYDPQLVQPARLKEAVECVGFSVTGLGPLI